jgi:hypothetical protein
MDPDRDPDRDPDPDPDHDLDQPWSRSSRGRGSF